MQQAAQHDGAHHQDDTNLPGAGGRRKWGKSMQDRGKAKGLGGIKLGGQDGR